MALIYDPDFVVDPEAEGQRLQTILEESGYATDDPKNPELVAAVTDLVYTTNEVTLKTNELDTVTSGSGDTYQDLGVLLKAMGEASAATDTYLALVGPYSTKYPSSVSRAIEGQLSQFLGSSFTSSRLSGMVSSLSTALAHPENLEETITELDFAAIGEEIAAATVDLPDSQGAAVAASSNLSLQSMTDITEFGKVLNVLLAAEDRQMLNQYDDLYGALTDARGVYAGLKDLFTQAVGTKLLGMADKLAPGMVNTVFLVMKELGMEITSQQGFISAISDAVDMAVDAIPKIIGGDDTGTGDTGDQGSPEAELASSIDGVTAQLATCSEIYTSGKSDGADEFAEVLPAPTQLIEAVETPEVQASLNGPEPGYGDVQENPNHHV